MDHTAKLRSMKGAIEEMQNGEKAMAKKDYPTAEGHFRSYEKLLPGNPNTIFLKAYSLRLRFQVSPLAKNS